MLKRVGQTEMEKNHVTPEGAMIRIKDASYPAPFHPGLEFNSPVHGNWNIVVTIFWRFERRDRKSVV